MCCPASFWNVVFFLQPEDLFRSLNYENEVMKLKDSTVLSYITAVGIPPGRQRTIGANTYSVYRDDIYIGWIE